MENEEKGQAMKTAAELHIEADKARSARRELQQKEKDLLAAARKMEREERLDKDANQNAVHYERMYSEIGEPLAGLTETEHGIVYAMAWEHGHSSGFGEVETYYGELAEMARKLLAAN